MSKNKKLNLAAAMSPQQMAALNAKNALAHDGGICKAEMSTRNELKFSSDGTVGPQAKVEEPKPPAEILEPKTTEELFTQFVTTVEASMIQLKSTVDDLLFWKAQVDSFLGRLSGGFKPSERKMK